MRRDDGSGVGMSGSVQFDSRLYYHRHVQTEGENAIMDGTVLVLGSHPGHGFSMARYTDLLVEGYRLAGVDVALRRPTAQLSSRTRNPGLRKLMAYVEQLIIFPTTAWREVRTASVVHIADHSDALWSTLLPVRRQALVITCHDLIAVKAARGELPEHRTRWTGRLYQRWVVRGLMRAGRILAVSNVTAADVRRIVPAARVVTVHNPVPGLADRATKTSRPATGRSEKYVLVVSSSGWRKRRGHAIRVWERLQAAMEEESLSLKIVGPPLSGSEAAAVPSTLRHRLVVETGVGEERLQQLYANALALMQTSLYEGFGWPIVEANVQGTPALCSDSAVFREIANGGVFIDDDLDKNDWPLIAKLLHDPQTRARAIENATRFSMDLFVEKLSEFANEPPRGLTGVPSIGR